MQVGTRPNLLLERHGAGECQAIVPRVLLKGKGRHSPVRHEG